MHGGWTAAILDTAMALSNLSLLTADQSFTTLDIRINYLRPITMETGEVRAEGRVIQGGRRISDCEAHLTDTAGKLLGIKLLDDAPARRPIREALRRLQNQAEVIRLKLALRASGVRVVALSS